jgi:hypothetical protein
MMALDAHGVGGPPLVCPLLHQRVAAEARAGRRDQGDDCLVPIERTPVWAGPPFRVFCAQLL